MSVSATDVRLITGIYDDRITDSEIDTFIQMAEDQINAEFRYRIKDKFYFDGTTREFYTYFKPVLAVNKVQVVSNTGEITTLTVNTDYAIDLTEGRVTIYDTVDLEVGNEILVYYVPRLMETYHKYLASLLIIERYVLNTADETQRAIYEQIQDRVKKLREALRRKPMVHTWTDNLGVRAIW